MTHTEEVRAVFTVDTAEGERGIQRYQKALERFSDAEKEAVNARAQREAAREEQQILRYRERLAKEASDRRVEITRSEYARLERMEREHQRRLVQQMRMTQSRAGGIGSTAGERAAGGGFFANANNRRLTGDAINMAAGTSGWVSNLDALSHFGVRAGGAAAVAGMAAKGYTAHSRMVEATHGLQGAMGERVNNSWFENPLTRGMMRALPMGLRPDPYTVARGDMQSSDGMAEQRASVQEELKKVQESRRGAGGYFRSLGKTMAYGSGQIMLGAHMQRQENKSFEAEARAQNKLLELDSKIAEKVEKKTAAQRMAVLESEKEGRLLQNREAMEERIKELNDANRKGEIGDGRRVAGIREAESERELADIGANMQARAQWRGVTSQRELTSIARKGEDVELRGARSRLNTAKSAQGDALTDEQKAAAGAVVDAARLEVEIAERNTRERKKVLAIDREIAEFRGSAEERMLHASEQALKKERERLAIAQEAGADAEREAQNRVAEAELADKMTKDAIAAQRITNASGLRRGEIGLASGRFALGQKTDSANQNERFDAQQAIQRQEAAGRVLEAAEELVRVNKIIAQQEASQKKADESTVQAQKLAQQALKKAKQDQLAVDKQMTFEAKERVILLQRQTEEMRAQTAAMQMANEGRPDQAALFQGRAQAKAEGDEALRVGRPEIAAEIAKQQEQREMGMMLDRTTNRDGSKRSRTEINREFRELRQTERRRKTRMAELKASGGLIGGRDMLTGERPGDQRILNQGIGEQRIGDQSDEGGLKTGSIETGSLESVGLRAGGTSRTDFKEELGMRGGAKARGIEDRLPTSEANWRDIFRPVEKPRAEDMYDRKQPKADSAKLKQKEKDGPGIAEAVAYLKEIATNIPKEVR